MNQMTGGDVASDIQDEVLFTVDGDQATLAKRVRIEDLGLTEPYHLEKWVIRHPQTLGHGVMIVASQYDRWITSSGAESKDRLDLLGLGADGRLVVAELKRGRAPDTVDLQAIKYAAMCSHFTLDQLATLHAEFLSRTEQNKLTTEQATEKLQAHCPDVELSGEAFLKPRIVLLAESYPDSLATSVVWLVEQCEVDITLQRYQAYETAGGETIMTVSRTYPIGEVPVLGPRRGPSSASPKVDLPVVEWTASDFDTLISLAFPVPIAVLNACAEKPNSWVSSAEIYAMANVLPQSGAGQLAGFGYSVRTRFARSNHPWEARWKAGGENVNYYRTDEKTANAWRAALEAAGPTAEEPLTESPEGSVPDAPETPADDGATA